MAEGRDLRLRSLVAGGNSLLGGSPSWALSFSDCCSSTLLASKLLMVMSVSKFDGLRTG